MPITDETKRRLLSLKEKMLVGALLEADAADGVIKCNTIGEYVATIAHRLGKDAQEVAVSSVQYIAGQLGIEITPTQTASLYQALRRIGVLEAALDDAVKRIDELEDAFTRAGKRVATLHMSGQGNAKTQG